MIKFVADVGANHNKDLDRVERLIVAAKQIGCDAVKFQLYKADRLYAPEFADKVEAARAGELPPDFVPAIAEACRRAKIEFHCTPFHVDDVYALRAYVDALKIASYSILDLALITAACRQGLPVGLSTGGATADEIEAAYKILRDEIVHRKITLYDCFPLYPAPVYAGMMTGLHAYRGYSDHTRRMAVILAAVSGGASVIEFHLDLNDRKGLETAHGHVWTADDAAEMIACTREFDLVTSIAKPAAQTPDYTEMRKWRTDAFDEMRPLSEYRAELMNATR